MIKLNFPHLENRVALDDDAVPAAILEHVAARWRHLQHIFRGALVAVEKWKISAALTQAAGKFSERRINLPHEGK